MGSAQIPIQESTIGSNMLFNVWGQFIDHDISHTIIGVT